MMVVSDERGERKWFAKSKSQQEVRDIVACREQEERDVQLSSPQGQQPELPWPADRDRNRDLGPRGSKVVAEKEKDILAPFLIRLGNRRDSGAEDASYPPGCLAEFKQRLAEHRNLIQERYERTQEPAEQTGVVQKNQLTMTKPH
ncbi:hypothetical protein FQN60_013927 [Etheostoma spectabile]|uniref:Uncharacterized protein n=1 Tax=Etheostoma spectabile TaxID=54343 RepID=A0A5J5CJV6_9PERO|nr:hypothetical protein FQN60_013927 [Etheostoma spectabile]